MQSDKNEKIQLIANHNIRATHDILLGIEKSKQILESFINEMHDVFSIVKDCGTIVRGNDSLSRIFRTDFENIIGKNISELFSEECWNIFSDQLFKLSTEKNSEYSEGVSFELTLNSEYESLDFLWHIKKNKMVSNRRGQLFVVVGRNVTKLKSFERKLTKIYSAIPLGIMTIDLNGHIESPYSNYIEYLLGETKIEGKDCREIIFSKIWNNLSKDQQDGVELFFNSIGEEEFWFDMYIDKFPKEIKYEYIINNKSISKWLSLSYNPIIIRQKVEKVLIVIEDVTERVKNREEAKLKKTDEGKIAKMFLEINTCESYLLAGCREDLSGYFEKLEEVFLDKSFSSKKFVNILHGIKGVTRTSGLSFLKEKSHSYEAIILNNKEDKSGIKEICKNLYSKLKEDWSSYLILIDAFQKGLQKVNDRKELAPLETVEKKLEVMVKETSQSLNKNVNLICDFFEASLPVSILSDITEIFIHLINNSLSHGIESSKIRVIHKKPSSGKINIKIKSDGENVHFEIEDDGRGIDVEKIKQRIISSKLMDQDTLVDVSKERIMQFIFTPNFSTSDSVSDISGRGIGLDVVSERIRELNGGGLMVYSTPNKGCRIKFEVKLANLKFNPITAKAS